MQIRSEIPQDRTAISAVNQCAFLSDGEARIVCRLREEAEPLVSLVVERGRSIVGHILFSPVSLDAHPEPGIMGLGPMAVMPRYQRQGLGSLLVRAGLEECHKLGSGAVVVLGHPEYYPRFGFEPASRFGITSEYDAPDDAFMALELEPGYLSDMAGTVRYHAAFAEV